jgi:hypothetical protein
MRLSSFKMPRWWQALWRARYPMGPTGWIDLSVDAVDRPYALPEVYRIEPMSCGCGYTVWTDINQQVGGHYPTLGGAIRAARRHAQEPQL